MLVLVMSRGPKVGKFVDLREITKNLHRESNSIFFKNFSNPSTSPSSTASSTVKKQHSTVPLALHWLIIVCHSVLLHTYATKTPKCACLHSASACEQKRSQNCKSQERETRSLFSCLVEMNQGRAKAICLLLNLHLRV